MLSMYHCRLRYEVFTLEYCFDNEGQGHVEVLCDVKHVFLSPMFGLHVCDGRFGRHQHEVQERPQGASSRYRFQKEHKMYLLSVSSLGIIECGTKAILDLKLGLARPQYSQHKTSP